MTVLFLIFTFAGFVLIDFLLNRKHPVSPAEAGDPASSVAPFLQPAFVDGFAVPEELRYHQGHSWLYRERKGLSRVGVDEFAAALAGNVDGIDLPKPGQWVRQGQKAWKITRAGETVEMLTPTEGEVVAVNDQVLRDPSLLRKDPYGKGWLFTIHVPDEETTFRNLVPRNMVKLWMRNAVERLYAMQPELAGAVAPDGGRPAEDLATHIPNRNWQELTREFFLSA
jgi:glycine cleavage system H lipoate-binding protein